MSGSSPKVRVLVIDDSALMRKLIPMILSRDPEIEVVGTAMDGSFGLQKVEDLRPHVVTLDLEMPRMDGMETLRQLTRNHRLPVVVVSAHTVEGASATFKALSLGAFDFVPKPLNASQARMDGIAEQLAAKVKIAARCGFPRHAEMLPEDSRPQKPMQRPHKPPIKVIAIGISTGGPNALQYLLSQLPGEFGGAIVAVQHMPEGFTDLFARRLNECCAIEVKEARSGDVLLAGRALICPGNRHMRVRRMPLGDVVVLGDDDKVNGHRPSADILFQSVAQEFGAKAIALLMTGMGEDGADAMGSVKAAGGLTVAQDESSCVVFGMPKAAIERGHAMRVVSLDALANLLIRHCANPKRTPRAAIGQEA
ncbi:MAG TPA: chemotaxis response regulator protein-glutamate methylesterase [Terriglobales bacterium]|nr:chemotaxis response regulator protein-glutamate methylesterase [Terriglobales bacterium]